MQTLPQDNLAGQALKASALSHRYGRRQALKDVSLQINAGEMLALVGPNGAGKTTLFNILTGLIHPQAGTARIFNHDLARDPRAALAAIGVVFQQRAIDLDLTAAQNLHYHAALRGMSRRGAQARIDEECARFGLTDKLRRRAGELSGGELRRLEIARALIHRPALLLLDEPTVGLDAPARRTVLRHLRELTRQKICAVLFSTHLFDEISADDNSAVLSGGRLLACGLLRTILAERGYKDLNDFFADDGDSGGTA